MQDELHNLLKQNLRDIHLPNEIGLWPLAPGWWIVIAFFVLAITTAVTFYVLQRRRHAYRRAACSLLQTQLAQWRTDQDSAAYLQSAQQILRRCVLHIQGSQRWGGYSGSDWLSLLHHLARFALSETSQKAVTEDCYQANPQSDIEHVHQELLRWIRTHRLSADFSQTNRRSAHA